MAPISPLRARFNSAVAASNTAALERILQDAPADFDVDASLPNGSTALTVAVRNHNVEMVKLLVNRGGANLYLKNDAGETYLHQAVYAECLDAVKLFSNCFSWGEQDAGYYTALEYAYYDLAGVPRFREFLKDCLWDETNQDFVRVYRNLKLYDAVVAKDLEETRMLLAQGADPNFAPCHGETSFHKTFKAFPEGDAFNLFLEHGTDVFQRNRWGKNALHYAVSDTPSIELVRAVLRMGVDPNERSNDDFPSCFGVEDPKSKFPEDVIVEKLRALVEFGADVGFVHEAGDTLLYWACHMGYYQVVEYLLSLGVDANGYVDGELLTFNVPIIKAITHCDRKLIEMLLDHGVKLNYKSFDGTDMIYHFIQRIEDQQLRFSMCKLFLRKGTNLASFLQLQFGRKLF